MSADDRCAVVHPEFGLRCERKANDCAAQGVEHTATWPDGRGEFWPNPHGNTPMHEYFRLWMSAKGIVTEEKEK